MGSANITLDTMAQTLLVNVTASGMSLNLRELVVHGQNVSATGAGTPGEVNGVEGYKLTLPALAGEISAVPEPSTGAMMLLGFGAIGTLVRRRRKVRVTYA